MTAARRLRIDLRDVDSPAIDTGSRYAGAATSSTTCILCSDDVACGDAEDDLRDTSCEIERQPRQSGVNEQFEAGTYYLVLDSENRGSFRCGRVELRVRALGP